MQIVVENHHVGVGHLHHAAQFVHLAAPRYVAGIGAFAALDHSSDDLRSGSLGQPLQFFERFAVPCLFLQRHAHQERCLAGNGVDAIHFLRLIHTISPANR